MTIFGKTWMLHVLEVLQTSPEENLAMIADTVRLLKEHGKFVVYDAEHAFDGCKDDRDYALATWQAAEAAPAPTASRSATPTADRCPPRSPRSRGTPAPT